MTSWTFVVLDCLLRAVAVLAAPELADTSSSVALQALRSAEIVAAVAFASAVAVPADPMAVAVAVVELLG